MRRGKQAMRAVLVALSLSVALAAALPPAPAPAFQGVFWQPDCQTAANVTDYRPLGAQLLILQWTSVEQENFSGEASSGCQVSWPEIQARAGHLPVLLGLHGAYAPTPEQLPQLAEQARQQLGQLQALKFSAPVAGYYAPIEIHPDWPAAQVRQYLDALPRPLWVSAYAGPGRYDAAFVQWLTQALPPDVHVLVQDGVGVGHATPEQAAAVVRQLQQQRPPDSVGIIMEVFRDMPNSDQNRSALPWELDAQFRAYRNLPRYAFDGGHYMRPAWIKAFLAYQWLRRQTGQSVPDPATPVSHAPLTPLPGGES